ncbi:MAG: hypothetical protein JSV12_05485 [Candidatus Bathyarchaeota archaeon]|nr:MAG: hypothetical protein JSV12_05485 [Candidatus Bathyarchaeota archaeon]
MKRTIEIDVPDNLNAFIESLAKFLKTKPDAIIKRTVAEAVKSIPDSVDKHVNSAKLKKAYKLK